MLSHCVHFKGSQIYIVGSIFTCNERNKPLNVA